MRMIIEILILTPYFYFAVKASIWGANEYMKGKEHLAPYKTLIEFVHLLLWVGAFCILVFASGG